VKLESIYECAMGTPFLKVLSVHPTTERAKSAARKFFCDHRNDISEANHFRATMKNGSVVEFVGVMDNPVHKSGRVLFEDPEWMPNFDREQQAKVLKRLEDWRLRSRTASVAP